jgi:WD40 repeat protein
MIVHGVSPSVLRTALISVVVLLATSAARAQGSVDAAWRLTYSGPVTSAAFSPDGRDLAVGSMNRTTGLLETSNGARIRTLVQCSGLGCSGVNSVAFAPDGSTVASAGSQTELWRVWDGTLLRTIPNGGYVAISPDGQTLAQSFKTGYRNRRTNLFSIGTGALIWSKPDGGGQLAFSPDGSIIAVIAKSGLGLWRASDGTFIRSIPGALASVAFSPDGQLVAIPGGPGGEFPGDYTIKVFRVADGALILNLKGAGEVNSVCFTPNGQYLISGSSDPNQDQVNGFIASTGAVRIWQVSDGALLKTYDQDTGSSVTSVAVSPEGNVFSYTHDSEIVVAEFPSSLCALSIMPGVPDTASCDGGTGTVSVLAPSGCRWTAVSRVDWISIVSGNSGSGAGTVHYKVNGNGCQAVAGSSLTAVGLLIVAEQTFPIAQSLSAP